MRVVVVIKDRKYEGWALRAGHHVTRTDWDHGAQTMTVWVEKGEGYVEMDLAGFHAQVERFMREQDE